MGQMMFAQPSQSLNRYRGEGFDEDQHLTENQQLLYRRDGVKSYSYNCVTQFCLHPVEMLKLFASLRFFPVYRIHDFTRVSPYLLQGNKTFGLEFKQIAGENLIFVDNC